MKDDRSKSKDQIGVRFSKRYDEGLTRNVYVKIRILVEGGHESYRSVRSNLDGR